MTTPSTPPIEYRLHNPIKPAFVGGGVKFNGPDLDADEYNYLFRQVLAGVHGSQAAVIGHIIQKLNTKLRALNVNTHYDPNNESIVARLLTHLNFDEPRVSVSLDGGGMAGPSDSKPRRSAGARTNGRTTPSIRGSKPDKKDKRADAEGSTQDRK